MRKESSKLIPLFCLIMMLGFPLIAMGEREDTGQDQPLPWQTSFQDFIDEVSRAAARTKAPTQDELASRIRNVAVMSDGAGFFIDLKPPAGTRQSEINHLFADKSFDWSIPVARIVERSLPVEGVTSLIADLDYEKKPAPGFHPPRGVYLEIHGVKEIKENQLVRVKGLLGKPVRAGGLHKLSGVCVVNRTDDKDGSYDLILVLNGKWILPTSPEAD